MSLWESESDERLLGAAVRDSQAFSAFYRRYERAVLAFFLNRVRDPELAADLTAEVFAAVLVSCARFQAGGAPASAWLFGIAQHKLAKSRRRGRVEDRVRRHLGMAPLVLEDEDLERIERLTGTGEGVMSLLGDLPVEQQAAVRARILEEHSYEQIAEELACSQSVVRKRVSRGLARLREQLGDQSA